PSPFRGLPSRKKLSVPLLQPLVIPAEAGIQAINYNIMNDKLEILRKQIDEIDESIVILLVKRIKIVEKVGLLKKKQNIPVLDSARWQKIIKSKKGYIKKIWETIHEEALKIEKSI
ncbi:MAG: chorismate mutase, partial [Patescibacteria group bacterium]